MQTAVQSTSVAAYREHEGTGKAAGQRAHILAYITSHGGDWTICELARAMGLEKSTVSARIWECLNETHELEEAPKRKDRHSGITARPVRLPINGQKELFS
jgi:hypothetical protein